MILPVDFAPCFRVDSEQALPRFLDGDRMLSRKMIPIKLVLINLTIPLGLRSYGGDLRLKGIPTKDPVRSVLASLKLKPVLVCGDNFRRLEPRTSN